jgi:hypothetical protein
MRLEEGIGLAQRIIAELKSHVGSGKPITSKDLAKLVGANWGVTRNCVRDLRGQGHLIASSRQGYFMATCEKDMQDTWDMINHQAMAEHGTCGDLKRAAQTRFSGQAQMPVAGDGDE